MGRAAEKTLLFLLCITAVVCADKDTCPDVRIVGLSGSEKLAVLQSCPGNSWSCRSKRRTRSFGNERYFLQLQEIMEDQTIGGTGNNNLMTVDTEIQKVKALQPLTHKLSISHIKIYKGERGAQGIPGKVGPAGMKGEKGDAGRTGPKDEGTQIILITDLCTGDKGAPGASTTMGTHELRIDLRDFEDNCVFAKYKSFEILGETEKYKLILGAFLVALQGSPLPEAPLQLTELPHAPSGTDEGER
ncbi:unnamed protein product [Natator depressus]